jgi:hypothetical protein
LLTGEGSFGGVFCSFSCGFRSSVVTDASEVVSSLKGLALNLRLLDGLSLSTCLRFLGDDLNETDS